MSNSIMTGRVFQFIPFFPVKGFKLLISKYYPATISTQTERQCEFQMNQFMQSQVDSALLSLHTLEQSIELAALKDDGAISKEEKKEIRLIRKAIQQFEKKMEKLEK